MYKMAGQSWSRLMKACSRTASAAAGSPVSGCQGSAFRAYFFKDWVTRKENWVSCYRKELGINTNMSVVAFHRVFKRVYLGQRSWRADVIFSAPPLRSGFSPLSASGVFPQTSKPTRKHKETARPFLSLIPSATKCTQTTHAVGNFSRHASRTTRTSKQAITWRDSQPAAMSRQTEDQQPAAISQPSAASANGPSLKTTVP